MKKRIFVAVAISAKLQEEIFHWEEKYKELPARWIERKNLHITLVPPWYEDDIDGRIRALQAVEGKISSTDIEFGKVLYGPTEKRPRLIWAEGDAPRPLTNLITLLENSLGFAPELRPWKMHLTLARFRQEDFPRFSIKRLKEEVVWRDKINSFVLMESHLSPSGADYEILKEFKL